MLLLGIDLGTSSIKVSVVDAQSQQCIASAQYPETESGIISVQPGWAEQEPAMWWEHVQKAILKVHATKKYNPQDIGAIGIAYQMHGLVMVNNKKESLRPSIIWCDSRAVSIGEKAFAAIGEKQSLSHLLNSPGNFTASKLAWVKENEPTVYAQTDKIMLPGDFIAMKLTGEITTSISALSEGVFWDFKEDGLSEDVFRYYGFEKSFIPTIQPVFSPHGLLLDSIANSLSLKKGIPVSYKAGDQPNNALSLNVLEPGEVAATAGTSGVVYAVSDQLTYDKQSRVNSFAHVNYTTEKKKIGVLLCINGTGILNRWLKNIFGTSMSYEEMNTKAATIPPGSEGLQVSPFGNGAERMLGNAIPGAQFGNIDLNIHTQSHLARAAQEGIAFAFRYGLDIMRENNIHPTVIRAGKANMFLSNVFTESLVNSINVPVELHAADGSVGAALGAGIGAGIFKSAKEAFTNTKPLRIIQPVNTSLYNDLYENWKQKVLNK
jgi:xylulokinase